MVSQIDIENENINRYKSQMVLCTFEQALAAFVAERWTKLSIGNQIIREIIQREPLLEGMEYSQEFVKLISQHSYLKELFDLSMFVTEGTPESECIAGIMKLSDELEIFNIRNAAAHPNRRFFQYYWFRLAAIAADPRLVRLGMFDVCSGLERAIQGSIDAPPMECLTSFLKRPIISQRDLITQLLG